MHSISQSWEDLKMPVQNTNRNTQWLLNLPDETWILTKNARITTSMRAATESNP